jgi:type II secretory pathway pseudopilin PulG
MTVKKGKSRGAFTILEIMIAITIFIVAALGTSAYRYGAALNARRADLQTSAVRTAVLLCESWNGTGGAASFHPAETFGKELTISEGDGPEEPDGFTLLGSYEIFVEGTEYYYYATLSWQNIGTDLRALSVIVNWDQSGQDTGSFVNANKSYRLTTYVENPQ